MVRTPGKGEGEPVGEEGVMRGQEKEERRSKWREGVGERGREKEVGESESLLGAERGG